MIVQKFDDWTCRFFITSLLCCVIIDTYNAVAKPQLGVNVGFDVANRVWWQQEHVSALGLGRTVVID